MVDLVGNLNPQHGKQNLYQRHQKCPAKGQNPVAHQRILQIGKGIDNQKRENLRQTHIKRLLISHIHTAVGFRQKQEKDEIKEQYQNMSVQVEFQSQPYQRIIDAEPEPCIDHGLDQNAGKRHLQGCNAPQGLSSVRSLLHQSSSSFVI